MDADAINLTPQDLDLMARTIATEDATPEGRAAVASVMMNRLRSGDFAPSMSGVILHRNAFEPVGSQRWRSLSPSDPDYQNAYDIARKVASGDIADPTGGAVNFYAPVTQAKLGRAMPDWAVGRAPSAVIGGQAYYAPANAKQADPFKEFPTEAQPAAPAASALPVDPFKEFPTGSAASPAAAAPAPATPFTEYPTASVTGKAGPNGLVWDQAGGHDPNTGALVIGGKPFSNAPSSPAVAATSGFLNGIPIIGPYLATGAAKGAAAANALFNGAPYQPSAFEAAQGQSEANYPKTALAGNALGGVAGTGAAMAAAPAAFGLGGGSMLTSAGLSGVSGAALSAGDTAARQGLDWDSIRRSAEIGGAFGAAAPIAGRTIGAGVNWLSNALARTTPAARNVANVLSDIGMTPQEAQSALARMGPNATLADIDPALTAEAGGLAAKGGAPTSVLKSAMAARAAGANDRVATAVDQYLGPRPDLTATQEAIQAKASADASPYYNAARASAQPMDITPVLSYIDGKLASATGGVKDALSTAKGYLTNEVATLPSGPGNATSKVIVPKDDPQALLSARQALDDFIERRGGAETTAGKNALREAQAVRGQLDSVLKSDPNIAAGDAAYATQMRNLDALQEGQDLFKPGTWIEDVNRSIAAKTPDQVYNMRQGALTAIHDALDNARQGDFSAARSLFAKATANRAKLDALFPNAGKIFDTVEGEMAMRATENEVARNSATAQRTAIQQKYAIPAATPLDAGAAIAGEAAAGGPGAAAALGARAIYSHARNALLQAAANHLSENTARGLAAVGPAQQQFLAQVARASRANAPTNALANIGNIGANLLVRNSGNPLLDYLSSGGR